MASGDEKSSAAAAPASAGNGDSKGPGRPQKKGGFAGRQRANGKVDQGRAAWKRDGEQKRHRDDPWRNRKRAKINEDGESVSTEKTNPFSKEEIESEQRRPKRKVAVLIGYSGTGYKGMQVNGDEPTIERDLFRAFVAAGAISKANADDPKKSTLVRCARTDKGVHAAGNVISLKLIIEDEDIVEKINDALPEQIRIWGIQRTMNSFSCYQMCDSRWYEYLMPAYSLLPPHPDTYLGKKIDELAKEYGAEDALAQRMEDVKDFWSDLEEKEVKPILEKLEPQVRAEVIQRLHAGEDIKEHELEKPVKASEDAVAAGNQEEPKETSEEASAETKAKPKKRLPTAVDFALRDIKAAYVAAKRRYRVSEYRLKRLQEALSAYEGSHLFHNYTVQKSPTDPSARRHIKSFVVDPNPIVINNTQWLSLKVHGQSFMMHQIRKMVGLATLLVRCGSSLDRIPESYTKVRMAIPKAPGLGLLLERPVFEMYNRKADGHGREPIDFAQHEEKMKAFKDKHIYQRIFEVEEEENFFYSFFNQIDQFKMNHFLWVTAGGMKVAQLEQGDAKAAEQVDQELDDEDEDPEGGDG
ncbi:hypothetical protein NLU13_2627 [Sarocladium strictum]|uniref:tRNA pseudouridine synthase 1 n=1 Tax=Sarocladium strictum TaxID=5046 RepID=A0AA39GL81_SARSR|nr:hypothetical protein NLU13_2627 [Sarocladium strictum]